MPAPSRRLFAAVALCGLVACTDDRNSDASSSKGSASQATDSLPLGSGAGSAPDSGSVGAAPGTPDTSVSASVDPGDIKGTFGPTERATPPVNPLILRAVRTSLRTEEGTERVVFEFDGAGMPGYSIAYEPALHECGTGDAVPVAGNALLRVRLQPVNAHAQQGEQVSSTIAERNRKVEQAYMKQVVQSCDFEAVVEWGIGLREKKRYRVLHLDSPTRLVVDILTR